ncbi:MAG: hypothetical protein KDK56_03470, partial [Simkania sp.]|nr:hypothetical protein [Simkania sp.]
PFNITGLKPYHSKSLITTLEERNSLIERKNRVKLINILHKRSISIRIPQKMVQYCRFFSAIMRIFH